MDVKLITGRNAIEFEELIKDFLNFHGDNLILEDVQFSTSMSAGGSINYSVLYTYSLMRKMEA